MTLISMQRAVNLALMGSITLFFLIIANFLFVVLSPNLIPALSSDVAKNISPCYRTLFHLKNFRFETINLVLGDSFSEGLGDEFLSGDPEFGIFNKRDSKNATNLIFGRAGYGNIGTLVSLKRCAPLLSRFTVLPDTSGTIDNLIFVFYEGNDLDNNLVEVGHNSGEIKFLVRFFFPLFEYAFEKSVVMAERLKEKIWHFLELGVKDMQLTAPEASENLFPVTRAGIVLPIYPQGSAMELEMSEVTYSIELLRDVLREVDSFVTKEANRVFLYLPSVSSSYEFDGPLRVQSYRGKDFVETTGIENRERSNKIKSEVAILVRELGFIFCDTTEDLIFQTNLGTPVHGPRDWKHFNKTGYTVVSSKLDECVSSSR